MVLVIETASILGLSKITTSRWYSKYKKMERKLLKKKQVDQKRVVNALVMNKNQELLGMLIDTTPEQLNLNLPLDKGSSKTIDFRRTWYWYANINCWRLSSKVAIYK